MIKQLHWRLVGQERSPFERGGRRLRVTVYCPTSTHLPSEQADSLALIRELARLDSCRVVDTEPCGRWRLEIDTRKNANGVLLLDLVGPDDRRVFQCMHPRDWTDR